MTRLIIFSRYLSYELKKPERNPIMNTQPAKDKKLIAVRMDMDLFEFVEKKASENFRTYSQELRRIVSMEKQRHEQGKVSAAQ